MRMAQEFSLDALPVTPGREAYEERRSRLLRRGEDTGAVVPGTVLEAQIALDRGWLLFTTHGIPFEEGLDITLLDGSCAAVDGAALFAAYATGTFRNLVLATDDRSSSISSVRVPGRCGSSASRDSACRCRGWSSRPAFIASSASRGISPS